MPPPGAIDRPMPPYSSGIDRPNSPIVFMSSMISAGTSSSSSTVFSAGTRRSRINRWTEGSRRSNDSLSRAMIDLRRERFQNVTPTHNADRLEVLVDNRNARNLMGEEHLNRIGDVSLRAQRNGFARHDLVHPLGHDADIPRRLHYAAHKRTHGSEQVTVGHDALKF